MKNHILLVACLILPACMGMLAGCSASMAPQPAAIALWPGGAPGSEGKTSPEQTYIRHENATTETADVSFPVVTNINDPSITVYLPPAGQATGAAVIVMPGGGHMFLSINHEGYDVAKILAEHGIAGIVLKYRLARAPGSTYQVAVHGLMDVQRAIRLVRSRAGEWGINPNRVGVLGFSAGGELALLAATKFDEPVAGSNDEVDKRDCRPDFSALLYPGGLNNPDSVVIPANMPPEFLCCTYSDRSTISKNLALFYVRLKDAGIPAELHIYGSGGHGWGVRPTTRPVSSWIERFMEWMGDRGFLK